MDAICRIIAGKYDEKQWVKFLESCRNLGDFRFWNTLKRTKKKPQILKSVGLKYVYQFLMLVLKFPMGKLCLFF